MTTPVLTAMYYVRHGVRLFSSHFKKLDEQTVRYTNLYKNMNLLPSGIIKKHLDASAIVNYSREYRVEALNVTLLRSWLNTVGRKKVHNVDTVHLLDSVFLEYVKIWKEENALNELKQSQSSSIYKFKDNNTDSTQVEEDAFKTFPCNT